MKRLILLLLTVCMSSLAFSEEHVVTIYFGGTSVPENAYDGANAVFENPNLLAVLHNEQNVEPTFSNNHHKIFVAGVGADPDCANASADIGLDLLNINLGDLQKASAHMDICRNWSATVLEARDKFLDTYLQLKTDGKWEDGDTVVLNAIGHSRGAVAAMWFLGEGLDEGGYLNKLVTLRVLTETNLIALDPVPGVGMLSSRYGDVATIGWDNFRLNKHLKKFVAIYADDERCNLFSAIIPEIPWTTKSMMFRVRGSHQTMVGSLKKGGHSPLKYAGLCNKLIMSNCDESQDHPKLIVINDLVALSIVELLSGQGWGGVEFSAGYTIKLLTDHFDDTNYYNSHYDAFLGHVERMNNEPGSLGKIYEMIRASAYFPKAPGLVPLEELHGAVDGCLRIHKDHVGKDRWPRCMTRVNHGYNLSPYHSTEGLNSETGKGDIPLLGGDDLSAEEAWNKLVEMGISDDDNDGVPSDTDWCPGTAADDEVDSNGCSDAQVDADSDTICNPDADSQGPSGCTGYDNCPLDYNPLQEDFDTDLTGDVCDSDADGDDVVNVSDNCPVNYNPFQEDFDSDLIGDACDPDIDGDDVANDSDVCADTPLGTLVDPGTGCSIAQLCPCAGPLGSTENWKNHAKYTYCIVKTSKSFVDLGLLSDLEKNAIVFEATHSSCGEK